MAQDYSPSLVTKNLVFCADAAMKSAAGPATLLYDKVNDNNGTMYNGTCLDFDGTNDYVTVPHNSILDNENALTIECWINTSFDATFPGEIGVVRKGSGSASGWSNAGWSIRLRDDIPAIAFRKKDDTGYWDLYTGDKIIDGNWHHIVGTFDTTTLRKYVDGVETQSTSTGQAYLTTTENLEIGRISAYLDGSISNVKLYNVALSAANVKELYDDSKVIIPTKNDASGGFVAQTNLKGWWPLTEGVGTIAYDGSGNGNDGTLTNMDPATDWLTGQTGCPQLVEGYNRPMLFDTDGYVNMWGAGTTLTLDELTDYTFSWWARSSDTGDNHDLFTNGGASLGGFHFNFSGTGNPLLYLNSTNYSYWTGGALATAQDDGQWHHWLLTYTGTASSNNQAVNSSLYVDGVIQAHGSTNNSTAPSAWGSFRLGRATSTALFSGELNEFAIYNGLLGSSERAALYVRGPNGGPLPPDPMSLSNSSDIIAYWRNDGDVTWADRSGNGYTGEVGGSPDTLLFKQGYNGQKNVNTGRDNQGFPLRVKNVGAIGFNGSSDYVSLTSRNYNLSTACSFLFWSKRLSSATNDYVLGNTGHSSYDKINFEGARLYLESNTNTDSAYTDAVCATDNEWHHYAVIVDAGTVSVYEDGVSLGMGAATVTDTYMTINEMGRAGTNVWFFGSIATMNTYDRALTYAEIQQNYNSFKNRFGK